MAPPPRGGSGSNVEVTDPQCRCVVAEPRVDLGEFIEADRVDFDLPVRVALGDPEPGPYRVRFVPVREGVARFGTPAGASITIAPSRDQLPCGQPPDGCDLGLPVARGGGLELPQGKCQRVSLRVTLDR